MIGAVCGLFGGLFSVCLGFASGWFGSNRWLLYLLPVGGAVIVALYKLLRLPAGIGTNFIFSTVRSQDSVPPQLFPAIFVSTFLTHLFGGSAGREGAALQIGGSLGSLIGRFAPVKSRDARRLCELCGMAAAFSALFGTPVAAAVFVVAVIDIGRPNYRAFWPVMVSSLTAGVISKLIGAEAELFPLALGLAKVSAVTLLQSLALGAACALVAILFCAVIEGAPKLYAKLFRNEYLRAAAGGVIVVALTLVIGNYKYNGGSMGLIAGALGGECEWYDFLLKLLFTALTLGAGFKGGEIVPSFCVGAAFGCLFAPLVGMSPALGAGLGMLSVFCGATNAPLASMLLSVELFGAEYLPLFAISVLTSYMLSSRISLYAEQRITEPKLGEAE